MGYSTDIYGGLTFNRELTAAEVRTINDFAREDHSIGEFPSVWCQWVVDQPGQEEGDVQTLAWDGGEKFSGYVAWLKYLIVRFFDPWGVKLSGELTWEGEDRDDLGKVLVTDSEVRVFPGRVKVDYVEGA